MVGGAGAYHVTADAQVGGSGRAGDIDISTQRYGISAVGSAAVDTGRRQGRG